MAPAPQHIDITLIGFNDLHGHLEPPGLAVTAQNAQGQNIAVPAGGVVYMARAIAQRRQASRHVALVTAGDISPV